MGEADDQGVSHLISGSAGQLKIFLGAAPGVGKTYTMLREARILRERGVDVVVGYYETHNRAETEHQLGALEVIPRRKIEFQGRIFEEVDVESVLARRPEIVVIDELAHTNVPGARHPKRYQDVEEILDHGIDVMTAVNIQHLETVRQEAAQLAGVSVRETIPESFLKRAAELEMIDVTPETLRHRLRDGAIYSIDKVDAALTHFFRFENLSALRELALREVAENVDEKLELSHERKKIPGPVGAQEKVLVCVNYPPRAAKLVAKAARMAQRMKADLIVLTIGRWPESPSEWSRTDKEQMDHLRAIADQYRGEFRLERQNERAIGQVIMEVAGNLNVTQVVIGQPRPGGRLRNLLGGNPTAYLLKHLRYVDLRIVGWRDEAP